MMDPALDEFAAALAGIAFSKPKIPFISSVTGTWISDEQACSAAYWASHIRNPVRFADGVITLTEKAPLLILELGPRSTLSGLINQNRHRTEPSKALPVLSNEAVPDADWTTLLGALANVISAGISVNWKQFYSFEKRRKVALPTYSFDGVEYWVKPPPDIPSIRPDATLSDFNLAHAAATVPSTGIDMSTSARSEIIKSIITLVEEASGFDLGAASEQDHFLELGLDSLVLTQMATSLKGRFEVDISFRQLMEQFTCIGDVADFLLGQMSPEQLQTYSPAAPAAATTMTAAAAAYAMPGFSAQLTQDASVSGSVEQLIRTQLAVMSQQLELLRGGSLPLTMTPAVAASATRPATTAAPVDEKQVDERQADEKPVKKAFGAQAKIDTSRTEGLSATLEENVKQFITRYTAKTPNSKSFTQAHRACLADPRVVSGFKPLIKEMVYPIVVKGSSGSKLWDIDGHEYVDLVNGFGTNFLGHAPDFIKEALHRQLDIGLEIGPQTVLAPEVAKLMCDIIGMDRAALCNTGSEAVIGALRLARTVTGRNRIVMFDGAYHGINDEEIVRATKSGKSVPAAAGIPPESVANVVVLDYGTDAALEWRQQQITGRRTG
jgi:acyl transferase domain-containing protein